MSNENPFKTVYKGDYIWPYIAPITLKAGKPPDFGGKPKQTSLLDLKLCQCDRHNWNPHYKRAMHLKKKEQAFREAMVSVAAQRTLLENEIIQHPCTNADDALMSMYNADFTKKEFPSTNYRDMMKDPALCPIAMLRDPKSSSYRDNSDFKRIALQPQTVQGPRPIDFSSSTQPVLNEPSPYCTEYMERISTVAQANLNTNERFRNLPSRDLTQEM